MKNPVCLVQRGGEKACAWQSLLCWFQQWLVQTLLGKLTKRRILKHKREPRCFQRFCVCLCGFVFSFSAVTKCSQSGKETQFLMFCHSLEIFSILWYKYTIIFSVWVPEGQKTVQVLFQMQAEAAAQLSVLMQFNWENDVCGKIPKDKYFSDFVNYVRTTVI